MSAITIMFATSCEKDPKSAFSEGDECTVSFNVGSPTILTRTTETDAPVLQYAVYDENDVICATGEGVEVTGNVATINLKLTIGQNYSVIFWASAEDAPYEVDFETKKMSINYGETAKGHFDAFTGYYEFSTNNSSVSVDVELKRPFAQINIGSDDLTKARSAGYVPTTTTLKVTGVYKTLDLVEGVVSEPTEVVFTSDELTEGTFPVEAYEYLAMSYVLVSAEKTVVDIEYTCKDQAGIEIKHTLGSVPVQRNFRTNIYGSLLTSNVEVNVMLDAKYYVADGVSKDEAGNFYISSGEGLKYVAEEWDDNDFAGKTITLETDVDMSNVKTNGDSFAPIGSTGERDSRNRLICNPFKGTFDGQGHTISNIYQSGWDMGYEWGQYGSIGLFAELEGATVKNVTIEGLEAQVEGGDISFIAGSATGDCTFENITITNSSIGTYNNGIGGIIGWSGAGTYKFKDITIGSDVVLGGLWGSFDSSVGGVVGQGEPGATYEFENVNIACRLDVYNDVTASYQYYLYRMSGMIIGRLQKTTTIDGANYPDMSQYNITCKNVTVTFGDWMNYHYCYGFNGSRYTRVEPGYAYSGLDVTAEGHDETCTDHMLCLPFTALFGGDQYGVRGITEYEGVTVIYPESYNPDAE